MNRIYTALILISVTVRLVGEEITVQAGNKTANALVENLIATQPSSAPDLKRAFFVVENLPGTVPTGGTIRPLSYSLDNSGRVAGINFAANAAPVAFSDTQAFTGFGSGYTVDIVGAQLMNNFSQFVLNKHVVSFSSDIFTFTEGSGIVLERTLNGVVVRAINDAGWMLAVEPENFSDSYTGRHFILKPDGEATLSLPEDTQSGAYLTGVNLFGEVIGSANPDFGNQGARGVYFGGDGKFRWLPGNGIFDQAYALNNAGEIVGSIDIDEPDNGIVSVPALWPNGTGAAPTPLGTLRLADGYEFAWANSINRWGHVVGHTRAGPGLWVNKEPVDIANRFIKTAAQQPRDIWDINDEGVMLADGRYVANGVNIQTSFRLRPVWPALAVDANRDGQIKFPSEDPSDATSAGRPYRFWINDDDDTTNGSPQWSDLDPEFYPPRRADSADRVITSARDCEDLTRIRLNLSGLTESIKSTSSDLYVGLKWRNMGATHPAIRLFRSADSAGGLGHIKDALVARSQANKLDSRRFDFCVVHADYANLTLDPIETYPDTDQVAAGPDARVADFVLPKSLFAELSENQPAAHLLFEGVQEGKGELALVLVRKKSDGTWEKVGDCGSVWLQLDNIRRMYVRAHSTPLPESFPHPWQVNSPPPGPYDEDLAHEKALSIPDNRLWYEAGDSIEASTQFPFVPSPSEQNSCVVFVHGIDMTVEAMLGYSQSFFKRLWWEGYRGRFISFRWATPLSSDGLFGWDDADENTSIFNSGEYRSWKGGSSLKKIVDALRNPASPLYLSSNPTVGLLAHSLGNACAGEALRQGMQVNSYVALKAAVALSCYHAVDTTAPPRQILIDADAINPTPQYAGFYNGYHGYLSSIGTANKVNYYGAKDFWLETGTTSFGLSVSWVTNQRKYKPDDPWDHWTNSSLIKYLWDVNQLRAYFRRDAFYRSVTDPHESMAFVSRPRTSALGAVEPPPSFSGLDLDSTTTYGFTEARFDHSGPFQRNIQLMYGNADGAPWSEPLYQRLMRDLQVNP